MDPNLDPTTPLPFSEAEVVEPEVEKVVVAVAVAVASLYSSSKVKRSSIYFDIY